MTLDENVDHTVWPCIPHDPNVDCNDALRAYRDPRGSRILRPQVPSYARNPPPPR